MIRFATERWEDVKDEIGPLWERHYAEIAQDKDRIPLDPHWEAYQKLSEAGALCIVAARKNDHLIGYAFAIVGAHLHYRSTIFANFDLYWIAPEHRGGRSALRMFEAFEAALKNAGVTKIAANTKLSHDNGRLFAHLGYRESERLYVKVI